MNGLTEKESNGLMIRRKENKERNKTEGRARTAQTLKMKKLFEIVIDEFLFQ